jgi:Berberine and berberine like
VLNRGTNNALQNRYVNFAYGGEKDDELYGAGKLDRLRELKKKWDEKRHFSHYNPIC